MRYFFLLCLVAAQDNPMPGEDMLVRPGSMLNISNIIPLTPEKEDSYSSELFSSSLMKMVTIFVSLFLLILFSVFLSLL